MLMYKTIGVSGKVIITITHNSNDFCSFRPNKLIYAGKEFFPSDIDCENYKRIIDVEAE